MPLWLRKANATLPTSKACWLLFFTLNDICAALPWRISDTVEVGVMVMVGMALTKDEKLRALSMDELVG